MPRPVAYLICSALLALFVVLVILPMLDIMGRTAGPFSPDARLDGSQVRIAKPDTLSFTVGLTLDYIEVVARHRAGALDGLYRSARGLPDAQCDAAATQRQRPSWRAQMSV